MLFWQNLIFHKSLIPVRYMGRDSYSVISFHQPRWVTKLIKRQTFVNLFNINHALRMTTSTFTWVLMVITGSVPLNILSSVFETSIFVVIWQYLW